MERLQQRKLEPPSDTRGVNPRAVNLKIDIPTNGVNLQIDYMLILSIYKLTFVCGLYIFKYTNS